MSISIKDLVKRATRRLFGLPAKPAQSAPGVCNCFEVELISFEITPRKCRRWRGDVGGGLVAEVAAHTKSEARALIKKQLGLERLPPHTKLSPV